MKNISTVGGIKSSYDTWDEFKYFLIEFVHVNVDHISPFSFDKCF